MACRTQVFGLQMARMFIALAAFTGCVRSHDVKNDASTDSNGFVSGSGGAQAGAGAVCESAACQPSALGFDACCTKDTAVCGLDANEVFAGAGCLEADAPGTRDSSCPNGKLTISGTTVNVQGCCRDDSTCGLMDTIVGLGCTHDPSKPKGASCTTSSSNGSGGTNGGTGGASMASTCDPASCAAGMFGLQGCCTDTDVCGYDASAFFSGAGCLEANAPGTSDSSCPSASVTVMGFTVDLPGCCRGDGTCGVMDSFVGLGCTLNPDMPMGAACAGPQ